MKRTLKKGLTVVLGLLMVMFMAMSVAFMQSKPTSADAQNATFAMMSSADIRVPDMDNEEEDDIIGIRFRATVADPSKTYKMIIIPHSWIVDYFTEEGSTFDYNNFDYVKVLNEYEHKDKEGTVISTGFTYAEMIPEVVDNNIQGSLVDIKVKNINREWFGIAYYEEGEGESLTRVYATVNASTAKFRVGTVASKVLNVGSLDEDDASAVTSLVNRSAWYTLNKTDSAETFDFGIASDDTVVTLEGAETVYNETLRELATTYGFEVKATSSDSSIAVANGYSATPGYFGNATVTAKFLGQDYTYNVESPMTADMVTKGLTVNAKPGTELAVSVNGIDGNVVYNDGGSIIKFAYDNGTIKSGANELTFAISNGNETKEVVTNEIKIFGLDNTNFLSTLKEDTMAEGATGASTAYATAASGNYYVLVEDINLTAAAYFFKTGTFGYYDQNDVWVDNTSAAYSSDNYLVAKNGSYLYSMFGSLYDTLDGLGHILTLDVGSQNDKTGSYNGSGDVANNSVASDVFIRRMIASDSWGFAGLFMNIQGEGTIRNLSYLYKEDFASRRASAAKAQEAYFVRFINGTTSGIENCYIKTEITAYTADVKFGAIATTSIGSVNNCIFDVQEDIYTSHDKAYGVYNNNIIITDGAPASSLATNSDGTPRSVAYANYSSVVSADNWVDNSSAFIITDGELYFFDKPIYVVSAPAIEYADGIITITDGVAGVEYSVMQKVGDGDWATVANLTAKLGDTISIAKLDLVARNNTYKVKLIAGNKESNEVEFTVYGLDNTNFVSDLKLYTIGDTSGLVTSCATAGTGYYFVLIEDITIDAGAYYFKDGTMVGKTGADINASNANYLQYHNNYAISAFGSLFDTLDGLGHSITLDVGSQSMKADGYSTTSIVATAPAMNEFIRRMVDTDMYDFAGLFNSVRTGGAIKNLSYVYKEDFANRKVTQRKTAILARQIYGGTMENCYIKAEVTAYTTEKKINVISESSSAKVLNTIFDLQSISANGEIARVIDLYATFGGTYTNNIVIGGSALASVTNGKAVAYATYDAAIAANNWLDTSSVFSIVGDELYFLGNKIYSTSPVIEYADGIITVVGGKTGVEYTVMMSTNGGEFVAVANLVAKLGDAISIQDLDLIEGDAEYRVLLKTGDKESNVIEFSIVLPAPVIEYADGIITVTGGVENVEYTVMQSTNGGEFVAVANLVAKLGDTISIQDLDLIDGDGEYKVKLVASAKESNVIEFSIATPAPVIAYADTVITVTDGVEDLEYAVWQSVDGGDPEPVDGLVAKVGDTISIADLNLVEGSKTYTIMLARGNKFSNEVSFTVYGLGNTNFVSDLKEFSVGATKTGNVASYATQATGHYFVLIEDITITGAAYYFKDGQWGTLNKKEAPKDSSYLAVTNNGSVNFTIFGTLFDTLDGLGHTLTLDVGSQDEHTGAANTDSSSMHDEFIRIMTDSTSSYQYSGLFTSIRAGGVIKNLSYVYKEDFADRKIDKGLPAFFARQVNGGKVENCYIKAEVTAYTSTSKVVWAICELAGSLSVQNNIFDIRSLDGKGDTFKSISAAPKNNIVVGATGYTSNANVQHADFASVISADNWLDTSSVWTISGDKIYLCGKAIN